MAKRITPKKQMTEAEKGLQQIMRSHLYKISSDLIKQAMKGDITEIKNIEPRYAREYQSVMLEAMSAIANDSIDLARKEVPKAKKVQLSEFEDLPPGLRKEIKAKAALLVDDQVSSLKKEIQFAYANNIDTTDSLNTVAMDLQEAADDYINGPSITAGANVTASSIVNEARNAFFFDEEVLEEIEAFEFKNGDPVTPICTDLNGTIFAKDDPNMFRYTPPLHWNCASYIVPILNGNLKNREIEPLKPSSKKLESMIQFHECKSCAKKLVD